MLKIEGAKLPTLLRVQRTCYDIQTVVLLILASVSITVVFGDNGLIEMAKSATDKTNEAVKKDLDDIQNLHIN